MDRTARVLIYGFAAIAVPSVAVVLIYVALGSPGGEPPREAIPPPGHSDSGARVVCRQFVTDALVAPATAEFGGYKDTQVSRLVGGEYLVVSHVDSQNRFGALIRLRYRCVVRHDAGDRWLLVKLELD